MIERIALLPLVAAVLAYAAGASDVAAVLEAVGIAGVLGGLWSRPRLALAVVRACPPRPRARAGTRSP